MDESVYGVRGMGENVRDWTSTEVTQGEGESVLRRRVLRGGAWVDSEMRCRCANRYLADPRVVFDLNGFRVARRPSRRAVRG